VGDSLTLFLTDGVLLGLCSASAVSSFLPVPRRGLINLEGYIAFSLIPHLSAIPLQNPIFCKTIVNFGVSLRSQTVSIDQ
jgi:hypothetical protein